jgi:hypothetical protein
VDSAARRNMCRSKRLPTNNGRLSTTLYNALSVKNAISALCTRVRTMSVRYVAYDTHQEKEAAHTRLTPRSPLHPSVFEALTCTLDV